MTDDHDAAPPSQADVASPDTPSGGVAQPFRFGAFIDNWWASHFPGSAVARNTEAWNVAHAAKEELKRLLEEISHV